MMDNHVWSEQNETLLRKVVQARSPELLPLVEIIGRRQLTTEEREALRGALAYELVAVGLEDDDEPNKYGIELDNLIGHLMYF